MKLPKPTSAPTGMPQQRRKSGLRTASDQLQEEFLGRQRALVANPTVLLPECPFGTPGPIRKLERILQRAARGGLPFSARFDKGILGGLRAVMDIAKRDQAPRLLDVRVDGQRRFFLLHAHVNRLVLAGIQNHDDPLARLLAYGPFAAKHKLVFLAGRTLWCLPDASKVPAEWVEDLGQRTGIAWAPTDQGWQCSHPERALLVHRFRGGPELAACAPCAGREGGLWSHLLQRALVGERPAIPVALQVRTGQTVLEVPERLRDAHRNGVLDAQRLVDQCVAHEADGDFVVGGRIFSDVDALVAELKLEDWEKPAARILLLGGHKGPSLGASDVLGAHGDRLLAAVESILGPGAKAWLATQAVDDVRVVLKRAHEKAQLDALRNRLPALTRPGPLASWIDTFVRDFHALDRPAFLQKVRQQTRGAPFPAHLAAFLGAAGLPGIDDHSFSRDQKEAGAAWTPLAKRVLSAEGADYPVQVRAYLEATGSGESLTV